MYTSRTYYRTTIQHMTKLEIFKLNILSYKTCQCVILYRMQTEKLAIQLHNDYQLDWSLDKTKEIVWWFKINCFSKSEIILWIEKRQNTQQIVLENELPDKYKLTR